MPGGPEDMADPLYELLVHHFDHEQPPPSPHEPQTASYLTRLTTLSLPDLNLNEPASLLQLAQSHQRNLQALSKRSHKSVISATSHLTSLSSLLPSLSSQTQTLNDELPKLENAAAEFAHKYDKSLENTVLDRRKDAMLLSRNADRVADVLDLPSLLSSTISAAQAGSSSSSSSNGITSSGGGVTSYSAALDLHGHIKRLTALFPQSSLVDAVASQSEAEIENLASILITSLQNPSLKLATAMRTVGWLRRVAPELVEERSKSSRPTSTKSLGLSSSSPANDGALGSLFLVCRLRTLHQTLEALDPLRELADQETAQKRRQIPTNGRNAMANTNSLGSQSERYLKRYVEIFREQSFNILSMYRSIFPSDLPAAEAPQAEGGANMKSLGDDALLPQAPPIVSVALHLVDMLTATLHEYMPNVTDKSARESLLTQVLYCAGSLGRLGADFGMMLSLLEEDLRDKETQPEATNLETEQPEWAQVMKKHRIQASRLEILARGVGSGKKGGTDSGTLLSPAPQTPVE